MQLWVKGLDGRSVGICLNASSVGLEAKQEVERVTGIPPEHQRLLFACRDLRDGLTLGSSGVVDGCTLQLCLRLKGGIDFQHREGSKFGGGGVMSQSQANVERKERLRKLALETIDLNKDPYFMKNHLGKYECKLCLTLHNNEGNYLAHTQGKRHQQNLARRAAMEAKSTSVAPQPAAVVQTRTVIKIGRPGYKVTKSRDVNTQQRSLLFELEFPECDDDSQPRHRFMSAYEQKVEAPDKNYQYILFACDPYETVGFKIPNLGVDKGEGKFYTNWDRDSKRFTLRLYFTETAEGGEEG
ncbi:unnamed protein product [Chrysoparadoxa australica]